IAASIHPGQRSGAGPREWDTAWKRRAGPGDRFRIQNQVPSGISPPFHVPEMDLVKYSTFPMIIPLSGIRGISPNRRNITIMSMSIESMSPAVNLNPSVFPVYPDDMMGQSFALSVLTVAAAESAIGLAIPVITFRIRGTIAVESINRMKGRAAPARPTGPLSPSPRYRERGFG
ncbi:hypothetical protein KI387_010671, partial [Taxus chinensis]